MTYMPKNWELILCWVALGVAIFSLIGILFVLRKDNLKLTKMVRKYHECMDKQKQDSANVDTVPERKIAKTHKAGVFCTKGLDGDDFYIDEFAQKKYTPNYRFDEKTQTWDRAPYAVGQTVWYINHDNTICSFVIARVKVSFYVGERAYVYYDQNGEDLFGDSIYGDYWQAETALKERLRA